MKNSHIAWTDDTYNPIIVKGGGFYCIKVSEGCKHCYAEKVNKRICGFQHVPAYDFKVVKPVPELELREDMLAGWARKGKPRKNFVSSMTDVFGEFVPDEWVFKILDAMVAAPKQIFQVLTKRSARMQKLVDTYCSLRDICELPQNIWLIVSVENQDAVSRAVDLLRTRCMVRGLSVEPMLGAIDLTLRQNLLEIHRPGEDVGYMRGNAAVIEYLDWVIVGGESGPQARPMAPNWAYNIQKQCEMYQVPFFFKQWGEWVGGMLPIGDVYFTLEDGTKMKYDNGSKNIFNWGQLLHERKPHYLMSVRVGKHKKRINDDISVSDNALFDGKHYFEFPKYLSNG